MSYDELNDYVKSFCASEWLIKTQKEICLLLGTKDLSENNEIIKFCYYKAPFEEDAEERSERQIIIFTKLNLIIIGTPEFDSNKRIENIELQTIRMKDIQKLILKTSAYDPEVKAHLEIVLKGGNVIKLNSNDANNDWRYKYVERIREISQYLLNSK